MPKTHRPSADSLAPRRPALGKAKCNVRGARSAPSVRGGARRRSSPTRLPAARSVPARGHRSRGRAPCCLRKRLRGIAVDRSRELIEHDHEREPGARHVSPMVQLAPTGSPEHRLILIDDRPVGASPKPPLKLPAMDLLVRVQPRRKPEGENVLRCCHHGLSSSYRFTVLPAARRITRDKGHVRAAKD